MRLILHSIPHSSKQHSRIARTTHSRPCLGAARRRVLGVVASACLAFGLPRPVAAQSVSGQARTLVREARKLMEKGHHAEACPKLEESLRLDPGIGTQFNLAHCWEQIDRTASAWGLFMDVAAAAGAAGQR